MRSGQVAEEAGVNVETLRYYERRGLIEDPLRSPGGHRLYPVEMVTVIRVIKAAQRLGFTLDETAELLELGQHRHPLGTGRPDHGGGLQDRARAKLDEVDGRIADLTVIRETLAAAIDAGCDDLLACAGSECCPIPFATIAAPTDQGPVGLHLLPSRPSEP